MPTDPKWRGIAKRSGQRIGDVIAIFSFMMVNASANATERGRTHNLFADDIASALDLETDAVESVLDAMLGKVWDKDGKLTGWEKRQPKREDSSAERARKWRAERNRTQPNATERPETETETYIPLAKANGHPPPDPEKIMFDAGIHLLKAAGKTEGQARALLGKWKKQRGGAGGVIEDLAAAQRAGAIEPVSWIEARIRAKASSDEWQSPC